MRSVADAQIKLPYNDWQLPGGVMSRRILNECAYCTDGIETDNGMVGRDRKVYCSDFCLEKGEALSEREWRRLMSVVTATRTYALPDQSARPIQTLL